MKPLIDFDTFMDIESQLEITIGTIKTVEFLPKNKKMLMLSVDFGDEVRIVVTNIGKDVEDIKLLEGCSFPFITNLQPAVVSGITSQAMIVVPRNKDGKIELTNWSCGSKLI